MTKSISGQLFSNTRGEHGIKAMSRRLIIIDVATSSSGHWKWIDEIPPKPGLLLKAFTPTRRMGVWRDRNIQNHTRNFVVDVSNYSKTVPHRRSSTSGSSWHTFYHYAARDLNAFHFVSQTRTDKLRKSSKKKLRWRIWRAQETRNWKVGLQIRKVSLNPQEERRTRLYKHNAQSWLKSLCSWTGRSRKPSRALVRKDKYCPRSR